MRSAQNQTEWQGHYLDGRTAARHPAMIRLYSSGLEVVTEGGLRLWWAYDEVRQTQGFYAGQPIRLERVRERPQVVQVSDPAFLTALHRVAGRRGEAFHRQMSSRRRASQALCAGLGLVVVTILTYLWGIPGLATVVAPYIPLAWEERLGEMVLEHVVASQARCADPERLRVIEDLVAILATHLQASPYAFRVLVVDDLRLNAFALPGGYIVLLRGLVAQTESAEELAGLVAHEMQHILLRHSARALLQHVPTGLLLAALSGDPWGASAAGFQLARLLGELRYSRCHEAEADAEGLRLLIAAGVDPAGMLDFFAKLQRSAQDTPALLSYLSTHPSPHDRHEQLLALAKAMSLGTTMSFDHYDWHDMRRICQTAR